MRFDVKIVHTQEFSLVVDAETAAEAQEKGTEVMNEGAVANPDKSDLRVIVERGVV